MPGNTLYAVPLLYRTANHRHALRVFADAAAALDSWAGRELQRLLRLDGGPLAAIARAAEDEFIYTSELRRLIGRATEAVFARTIEPEDSTFYEAQNAPLDAEFWSEDHERAVAKVTAVSGKDGHLHLDDVYRVELSLGMGRAAVRMSASRVDYYVGFQTAASARMFDAATRTGCDFSPMTMRAQEDLDDLQELLEGVRLR